MMKTLLPVLLTALGLMMGCADRCEPEPPSVEPAASAAAEGSPTSPSLPVVVSSDSASSSDPYDIVASNIEFLNALMAEHLRREELSADGLRSYYVDYLLAQVNNGGFSQFVYNSRWDADTIRLIREGLRAMGAVRHLDWFERQSAQVDRLGAQGLERLLAGGDGEGGDRLGSQDSAFFALSQTENLIELNAKWLKSLPHLVKMPLAEMPAEVERRAAALPDREARVAQALADEPRFVKLIRALCQASGHELEQVTAGDPTHQYKGRPVMAWHFITDRGHRYMVEAGGKAMMFDGKSNRQLAAIEAQKVAGGGQ